MVALWQVNPQEIVLRGYQQDAIASLRKAIGAGHRRLILQAQTGAGKTVMASFVMRSAVEKRRKCLFLAHARQLILQCSEKLTRYGVPHGVIMAGEEPYWSAPVQVASRDTLLSRYECLGGKRKKELPPADVIVLDECHGSLTKGYTKILEQYPNAIVLGLTATPVRGDGRGLGDIYTHMVQAAKPSQLIGEGSLVPTRIIAPREPDLKGVRIRGGDYILPELAERMQKVVLVGDVFSTWEQHASDRQTVVFAAGVNHSIAMRDLFQSKGITAEHIDGTTSADDRREIFKGFETGDIQVLCSCGVLREGWDAPWCSCGILLQPTRKLGTYLQMAGRLQRPWPGKTDALLLDHAGAVHRHGFPDEDIDWVLESTVSVQERIEEARKAKPEREAIVCPKCHAVRRGGSECPSCGHVIQRRAKTQEHTAGELSEVSREQAAKNKKAKPDEKQKFWDECLGWAIGTGKKVGAAGHRYRHKYGVWPNHGLKRVPRSSQWRLGAKAFYEQVVKGNQNGAA